MISENQDLINKKLKLKINYGKNKKNLTIFFILSYALMTITVFIQIGVRILIDNYLIDIFLGILAITTPTISAVIISGLNDGFQGIKNLFSGFRIWKVNFLWYFAGLLFIIAPLIFALFYILLGGEAPGPVPNYSLAIFLFDLFISLISGPLNEEAGWRGYALPRLQSRFSALTSSVILGVLWGFWHLPLYLVEIRLPFYIFIFLNIVLSILITWGYNNTNGSLVIAVLFHYCFNFVGTYIAGKLGLLPTMMFYLAGGILIGIYVIIVIIYYGPKRLSRKPESELPFEILND
ncbi:MAG: CPBP family intramembrane glutamic endopeptidase [Candidatus Hodarchaeota archaeon]